MSAGSFSQRFGSVLVDMTYMLVVLLAAKWKIIGGGEFSILLGGYGTGRVLVGKQKQDTNAMIGRAYIAGQSSDRMRAVRDDAPPPSDDDSDPPQPPRAPWRGERESVPRARSSDVGLERLDPPAARPGSGKLRDHRRDPSDPPRREGFTSPIVLLISAVVGSLLGGRSHA